MDQLNDPDISIEAEETDVQVCGGCGLPPRKHDEANRRAGLLGRHRFQPVTPLGIGGEALLECPICQHRKLLVWSALTPREGFEEYLVCHIEREGSPCGGVMARVEGDRLPL